MKGTWVDQPLALRCLRFHMMQMSAFLTNLLFSQSFFVWTHYCVFEKPLWTCRCMWSRPYLQVGSPVCLKTRMFKPILFFFLLCGVFKRAAASVRSPLWLTKPAFQQPSSAGAVKRKRASVQNKSFNIFGFILRYCHDKSFYVMVIWPPCCASLPPPPIRGKMCTPLNPLLETSSSICIS